MEPTWATFPIGRDGAPCAPILTSLSGPTTSRTCSRLRGWARGSELRRSDSNRRPAGYEPDELPLRHSAIELSPRPENRLTDPQCVGVADGDATGVGNGLGGVVTRNVRSLGFA